MLERDEGHERHARRVGRLKRTDHGRHEARPLRAEADSQLCIKHGSSARIAFQVGNPILDAAKEECAQVWNDIGKHLQLKESECITSEVPVTFPGREYQRVRGHGLRGLRVRQPQKYIQEALSVLDMVGCKSHEVPEDHSRYRAGVGKFQYIVSEYPDNAFALKN